MNPTSFVIAALPRSGTVYTVSLYKELDLCCHHERLFNSQKQVYYARCRRENEGGPFGDVSWMAVPFLEQMDPGTLILHQTRDHISVLNSLYGWEDEGFRGGPCNEEQADHPSGRFVREHCPDIFKYESDYVRILEFYLDWYARIEKHSVLTYDVLQLQDPYFVRGLINFTHGCGTRSLDRIVEAINAVPTDRHHRGPTAQWAQAFLDKHPEYREKINGLK